MPHETPHHALSDPLGDEIAELCAHLDAGQYRLLTLLYRYDEAELWTGWRSCAHWLSWRTGVTLGPARERVRVARCLASLPRTAAEMEKGRLSWSKTRALTRIATPGNETRLLEFARDATASQVERLVRAQRSAEAAMAAEDGESEMSARRHLTVRVGEDGMYRIRGRLPPEVGALLMEALDAAGDELYRAERAAEASEPKLPATPGERHHDALGAWLEDRTDAEVQLVVHTVAVDEGEGEPVVSTEDGSHVPAGTSRRLTCDPEVVEVTRGLDGSVLDVGRKRRTVGWRLRKALDVRDGGCRFPGCGSRYTQAHHAVPWSEGGETALDNLILLCRFHHRTVHEGGWRVEMGVAGAARFTDPAGRIVPAVPPARPDVKAPQTPDAGLGRWHRQKGINPWTSTTRWQGDRLDLDWALWVLWGQYEDLREAA
ncbi:DUF222 domain-containing protein [Candidatus Palauibacter sp.]|uniref:HNH endonuclease signature motif containing protein n=1 Tax=Candidatus Palauibacter sp. TaxID=3101350 RepID=UPI003B58DD5E